ncbi:uncharacterized protein [Tursiops truncatus]|uniref:Uncharacterized protein LOC109547580 n=1 Tax=Tursiops truncatus TaxID=9739 RepID=A0A6J3RGN3_TURTR|nr:uncharacterized protein LOC109547580 [Tursiops truncatus]XP_033713645.1 uncharacterized protein LOC109547580 [Tursiops truncatus]
MARACLRTTHARALPAPCLQPCAWERSWCIACPTSWKLVSRSSCCSREGRLGVGLVKLATMAAMAIWQLPSCCRQPGCRPKQAACLDFPTLRRDVDGAPLPQRSPGPRPTGSPTHAPRIEIRSKVSPSSSWEMPSSPRVSACMGKASLSSTESACVRNPSRRDFRACSLTSSLRITQFSWNPETEGAGDRGPRPPHGPRARSFWNQKRHERDGL